jgi:hypothetical protein
MLAIGTYAIAGKQFVAPGPAMASSAALASISPETLMRSVGPLAETQIASFY